MMDSELDRLIAAVSNRAIPAYPPALESKVLRRLHAAKTEGGDRLGLDWLLAFFQQTRLAAATLAGVLLISATVSIVATSAHAGNSERRSLASNALGFDVFQESEIVSLDR